MAAEFTLQRFQSFVQLVLDGVGAKLYDVGLRPKLSVCLPSWRRASSLPNEPPLSAESTLSGQSILAHTLVGNLKIQDSSCSNDCAVALSSRKDHVPFRWRLCATQILRNIPASKKNSHSSQSPLWWQCGCSCVPPEVIVELMTAPRIWRLP